MSIPQKRRAQGVRNKSGGDISIGTALPEQAGPEPVAGILSGFGCRRWYLSLQRGRNLRGYIVIGGKTNEREPSGGVNRDR